MALAALVPFKGPKKSRFLGPPPLKCPELWIVPPQNHFVPPHINNRYIGCFMYRPCQRSSGLVDKASDYESEDCRFESCKDL